MGEEQRSLWVGSLPTDVTTDEIREKFSKCGKIDEVFIGPRKSHEQYVYCFVHFRDAQGFENAMRLREDELMLRSQLLRLKKGLNRQHSRVDASSEVKPKEDRGGHRDKNAWRDDRNDRSRRDWDGNGRDGRDGRWRKEPSQFWWDAGASGSSHPMKLQVKAGYEERRIYIGNLPAKVTEDDIRHHFHTFGEIEFVSLKHKTKEEHLEQEQTSAIKDDWAWWAWNDERSDAGKLLTVFPEEEDVKQIFFDDNDRGLQISGWVAASTQVPPVEAIDKLCCKVNSVEAIIDDEYFLRKLQICHGGNLLINSSLIDFRRQMTEVEEQKSALEKEIKDLQMQLKSITEAWLLCLGFWY
eukprot:s1223_g3.t1